jgi:hypothetical protein
MKNWNKMAGQLKSWSDLIIVLSWTGVALSLLALFFTNGDFDAILPCIMFLASFIGSLVAVAILRTFAEIGENIAAIRKFVTENRQTTANSSDLIAPSGDTDDMQSQIDNLDARVGLMPDGRARSHDIRISE